MYKRKIVIPIGSSARILKAIEDINHRINRIEKNIEYMLPYLSE